MASPNNSFINLGSVTQAHKASKLLETKGISARVSKISTMKSGCSWGVSVHSHRKDEALVLLRASSFKIM